jgi:rod shape-determining protein MreC
MLLIATFGLLALDQTQRLNGQEQWGGLLVMPVVEGVSRTLDGAGEVASTMQDMGKLRSENRALKAENARLQAQNAQASQIALENEQLRSLLGFQRAHPQHQYVVGRLIGRGSNNLLPMVTIDVGETMGIKVGMTVVAQGGLVGRIVKVGARWANVLPLINPNSSVAAVVDGTSGPASGIVETEPGKGLALRYVSTSERLPLGAWVLTSGVGGGYPPNVPIGVVSSVVQNSVAMYQTAALKPGADIGSLGDVMVITDFIPIDAQG